MRAIHGIWETSYLRKRKPDWVREGVGIVWSGAEVELGGENKQCDIEFLRSVQRKRSDTEYRCDCLDVCYSALTWCRGGMGNGAGGAQTIAPRETILQEQSSNISINASFPIGIFPKITARCSPGTPVAVR